MADGFSIGLGFTLSLTLVASLREILGAGTWFGRAVFGEGYEPFASWCRRPALRVSGNPPGHDERLEPQARRNLRPDLGGM